MNLAECSAYTYRAYHANYESRWYGNDLERKERLDTLSLDEYVADALRRHEERWAPGGVEEARDLYAGSTVRAKLSDTEITALANRYDPYNMDDDAYDAFLDDLQSMGVISEREKSILGYNGLTLGGYYGRDGEFITVPSGLRTSVTMPNGKAPMIRREEADGDIVRWLSERVMWTAGNMSYPGSPLQTAVNDIAARRNNELFQSLNGVVSRMAALHPESKRSTAEDEAKAEVVSQFADAGSRLYRSLLEKMKDRMRDAAEEEQEQAVVDALDDVLAGMSQRKADGKKPDLTTSTARISMAAQAYKPGDPRRVQLEQAANQMRRMGIHLHMGGSGEEGETLTQRLIREETQESGVSTSDLIADSQEAMR